MASTNPRSNSTLAMPPGLNPSSLDTITEVAHLLSRLRTPQQQQTTTTSTAGTGTGASSNQPGATPATAPTPSQPSQQQQHPPQSQSHPPPSQPTPTTSGGEQQQQQQQKEVELTLKEIPAAADALKHRFQRARAQIATLPDLERSIGEQRAEMAVLEARLAKQREVLARLRDVGVRFAAETSLGRDGKDRDHDHDQDQDQEGDSRML